MVSSFDMKFNTAPPSGAEERGGDTFVLHNWKRIPKFYPALPPKANFSHLQNYHKDTV